MLLDQDPGGRGARVLDDVGERLAPDAEDLSLSARFEGETALGRLDLQRGPVLPGQSGGLCEQRRHEPVLQRVTAQLGDELSDLGLRGEGQLPDRPEVLREAAVVERAVLRKRLLGRARVQQRGEQRLGHGVVQVARDPVALLRRLLALAALGLGQLAWRPARAR